MANDQSCLLRRVEQLMRELGLMARPAARNAQAWRAAIYRPSGICSTLIRCRCGKPKTVGIFQLHFGGARFLCLPWYPHNKGKVNLIEYRTDDDQF